MTDSKPNTQSKAFFLFSICCFYFMMPSMGIMTPIFSVMAKAFPDVPFITITYIGTIVALFQIFGSIAVGAAVGKFLKYKTALIIAFALYIIGGIVPAFFPDGVNFTSILICRAIFGFGLGMNAPIGAILLTRAYPDQMQRAKMLGFGMVFFNIFGFLSGYLGAFLATLTWQTAFWGHAVGIIGLVAALVMKEPAFGEEAKKDKIKITPSAILWPLVFAVEMTLVYGIFTMGSMVLAEGGMAAGTAGLYQATGISFLTFIGIGFSLVFGWVYRILNKWVVAFGLVLVTVGIYMIGSSGGATASVTMFLVGWFIAGIGQQGVTIGLPMIVSTVVDKGTAAVALGLTMGAWNMGGFLSTPWAQAVSSVTGATSPGAVLKINGIAMGIFTVIMIIVTMRIKKDKTEGLTAK